MKPLRSLALATTILGSITCSITTTGCTSEIVVGDPAAQTIQQPPAAHAGAIDKVDLLFVVDNSRSMADKQDALAKRIPELMRLLTQIGVSPILGELPKITDLHVAVISSSLGSQGTSACDPARFGPHVDDRAHLLPRAGESLPALGYEFSPGSDAPASAACPAVPPASPIRWVLDPASDPSAELHGEIDLPKLESAVTCTVLSAGDDGCGYEMPLEAMYRFLADPAPPLTSEVACTKTGGSDQCGSNEIVSSGRDETLLAQRAAFLRPDSLLAVVIISDESDSSLRAEGLDWLPWAFAPGTMLHGTAGCAAVPDDFEFGDAAGEQKMHDLYGCYTGFESNVPGFPSGDSAHQAPWATAPLNSDVDGRNLRAFHQVQRFGYEFLYPTSRYVGALTQGSVKDAAGNDVPNPIFAGGRARDMVVLAGILGAPPSLVNDATGYPKKLADADWDKLVSADPSVRDPHMIESIAPRAGIAKFAGDASVDPVNGGDRDVANGDDLQYACLGSDVAVDEEKNSECQNPNASANNPACLASGGERLRAYPAIRPLRVIRGVGQSGYVASICDASYRGAIAGIATKIGQGCAAK